METQINEGLLALRGIREKKGKMKISEKDRLRNFKATFLNAKSKNSTY